MNPTKTRAATPEPQLPAMTVSIVLFKGEEHLPACIQSLQNAEYNGGQLRIVLRDHSPRGEALSFIRQRFPALEKDARFTLTRGRNTGHSGGHNAVFRSCRTPLFCVGSFDMVYEKDTFKKLAEGLSCLGAPDVAAPLLLRLEKGNKTCAVDSAGIALTRFGHFFDDTTLPKGATPSAIFGPTGALFACRRAALAPALLRGGNLFEPLLHYKNDVELAIRLRQAGLETQLFPAARAYHSRAARAGLAARFSIPRRIRADSLFGHLFSILRHWRALGAGALLGAAMRVGYAAIFEIPTLPAVWRVVRCRKQLAFRGARVPPQHLRAFFGGRRFARPVGKPIQSITAVVLDYWKGRQARACVRSLLAQKIPNRTLTVVLRDHSCSAKNARFYKGLANNPRVKIQLAKGNAGYPRGCNAGASAAAGADAVLIINPDIALRGTAAVEKMCQYLEQQPAIGALGVAHQLPQKGALERVGRRFPSLLGIVARRTVLRRVWPFSVFAARYEALDYSPKKPAYFPWIRSSFLAIPGHAWRQMGGFSERFFIFFADVQLGKDLLQNGWLSAYEPQFCVDTDGVRASARLFSPAFWAHVRDAGRYFFGFVPGCKG